MKTIKKYSDQAQTDAALQLSLEQLEHTQDVLTLILLVGIVWFVLYLYAMWRCVNSLKVKHHSIWESLRKPTTFTKNFKMLGFTFSNQVKAIPKNERWQFSLLRWLAFIGIIYFIIVIIAMLVLL